ncbi:hypothetical protein IM511_04280 [Erythrobacteraceae bacterium E2-1 Yellow Sea]|nr:hypothetical protein [Erythrobacteraceae bacterium E2-1 Yellow Sea]
MNIPKIDLSALPGLDVANGIYGSISQVAGTYDDKVVAVMVYVYETVPPENLV